MSTAGSGHGAGKFRSSSEREGGSPVMSEDRFKYALNIAKVRIGEDLRTTLMIRNIPNKYTQRMVLALACERHLGMFDFFYLPIDFKNRCNVGYAFINFASPEFIIPFYEEFNNKKWDKFNSEKVCEITYARIQGKAALVQHFQSSSVMSEDKKYHPIIINAPADFTALTMLRPEDDSPLVSPVPTRHIGSPSISSHLYH